MSQKKLGQTKRNLVITVVIGLLVAVITVVVVKRKDG